MVNAQLMEILTGTWMIFTVMFTVGLFLCPPRAGNPFVTLGFFLFSSQLLELLKLTLVGSVIDNVFINRVVGCLFGAFLLFASRVFLSEYFK